ncbi:MAG: GH3 auxin-responsive promoter family protein, partial [Myxococcota bacterium]
RCDLGDVIKVEGVFLPTPVVRFLRREGEVISLTGEKVTGEQLVQALSEVLPGAGSGFAVHGVLEERPHLAVALEAPISRDLVHRFDKALCRLNREYEGKRSSGRYEPPRLHSVPAGAFDRWRAERVHGGAADAQVKDPITVTGPVFDRLLRGWGPS